LKIIPAIDLIEGKCVRLTQGDYAQTKIYNENPLEVAKMFADNGVKYLHLVDLDGAKAGRIINWKVLEKIAHNTNLHIDFGGGLRTNEDLKIAFDAGAKQITGGSIAIKQKDVFLEWLAIYGNEKIILGADVFAEKIAISGWQTDTSVSIWDFLADFEQSGITQIICTDIEKDGKLEGISLPLYQKIREKFPKILLTISGGVHHISDIEKASQINPNAIIIGKAIYENRITWQELRPFLDV
jgi:phosphoribosylformimino-5-aminoimidazole carboxamide ribotide isomerase